MSNSLENKIKINLKKLPDTPGIYLFYDSAGRLIYVGKATSLRSRVRSYFHSKKNTRPIETMWSEVKEIKWQETDSALEAVIEESIRIKKYQPKYNVLGKDGKSWNYIVITNDYYPLVIMKREQELMALKQKSNEELKQFIHIFGPYPGLNGQAALKLLRNLFTISFCQKNRKTKKPCFYYQMGQCLGVCTLEITAKDYRAKVIRPLVLLLSGKKKLLLKKLEREMTAAAKKEDFEEAGRIRDQLKSLTRIHDIALLNRSFVENYELKITNYVRPGLIPLGELPIRIEGYDISNLGMTGKVGSLVVFDGVGPIKSQYRKFKIKTVVGQSDVDCLEEVLRRRLKHSDWPRPNVILVDGGLPQVNRAVKIIQECKLDIPVVGIAKGPERKKNELVIGVKTREFIRWVDEHQEILIKVRDEAHRFAITYQRSLRKLK